MPGTHSFKLEDGTIADVPEESLDAFYAEMNGAGLSFTEDKSAPVAGPAPTGGGAPPAEPPSMMQRFLGQGSAIDNIGNSAPVRGLAKALSFGASDEMGAGMNAATGGNYGADVMRNRFLNDKASNESPIQFGAGRAVGMLPGMMASVPAMAYKGAAGLGARIGMGGAQGALAGAGESDSDDLGETVDDAGIGGMFGAGASALGELGGAALKWGGDKLRGLGVGARRASAGGSAPEYQAVLDQSGIDKMETGLDQRFDELGLAKGWKPQSATDVYKRINPEGGPGMLQDAGRMEGDAMDAAGAAGARGDWGSVRQSIDNRARAATRGVPRPSAPTQKYAAELNRIGDEELPVMDRHFPESDEFSLPDEPIDAAPLVEDVPVTGQLPGGDLADSAVMRKANQQRANRAYTEWGDHTNDAEVVDDFAQPQEDLLDRDPSWNPNAATPRELHAQKMEFEDAGKFEPGVVASPSEAIQPTAYRGAASDVRAELGDTMQNAGPEYSGPYNQGRSDYKDLATFGAMAGKKAAQNKATNPLGSPWTYGGAAMGGAVGLGGGLPGAAAGAITGGALGQKYGQDVAGLGMMGAGNAMWGGGAAMSGAGKMAGQETAYGIEQSHDGDASKGRGYMLTEAVQDALRNEPQLLGSYLQQFGAAAGSGDSAAISTLITKLSRTDPGFKEQVLPALRARTQGGY